MHTGKTDRPRVVSLIAAFLFAATVIATVVGTSLLHPGTFVDRIWNLNQPAYTAFQTIGKSSGVLLLLLALGTAAAGAGLLRGARWAWWFAVALFTLNGLGDLVTLLATRDLLKSGSGILVAATFLFCLSRPHLIAFFQLRRRQ